MGREPQPTLHHRSAESSAKRLAEALDAARARRNRLRRTMHASTFAGSRHHELELQKVS